MPAHSNKGETSAAPRTAARRGLARLAAVQALYQMDIAGTDLSDVIEEFTAHRLAEGLEEAGGAEADTAFFGEVVRGVVNRQRDIDRRIDAALAAGWRLQRLDTVLRALLRAGAFELACRPDVPARVVIDEYVDLAHAFYEHEEPGFVNAVLDTMARTLRAEEFSNDGKEAGGKGG